MEHQQNQDWLQANRKFGERIAYLRVRRELTQLDVEKQIDVLSTTLSKWENGNGGLNMSVRRMVLLARTLETTTEKLLRGIRW